MSKRIRLGILGLGTDRTSWSNLAHLPYLQSEKNRHFDIVALCNSSVESAQKSIDEHYLDSTGRADHKTVKAYGDPVELAKDPNVDLVVCIADVRKHKACIEEAVKLGKNVFVEWPICATGKDAEELLQLVKGNAGQQTLVGLEEVCNPAIQCMRSIVNGGNGTIGKVLSVECKTSNYSLGATVSEKHTYALARGSGAGMIDIHGAHNINAIQYALDDMLDLDTIHAVGSSALTPVKVLDKKGNEISTVPRTTPDHLALSASFKGSSAPFSLSVRNGAPFPGDPVLSVTVEGSKGKVRMTASQPAGIETADTTLELQEPGQDRADKVAVDTWYAKLVNDVGDELPMPARNVARLYDSFAGGHTERVADFEAGVRLHRIVDRIYKSVDENGGVK